MKSPEYIICTIIAIIVAAMFYISMNPIMDLPVHVKICDSLMSGILFGILSLLLKDIVKYANYRSFSIMQQVINYTALSVLFILGTVVTEYYILQIVFPIENIVDIVYPTLAVRIIISLLFFGISVIFYEYMTIKQKDNESETSEEKDIEEEVPLVENNTKSEEEPPVEILEHIAVKNGQKIDVILIPDIIYLKAEGDYVMIHSTKGKFLKEQTMKYFDSHLPSNKFVRVHRSGIVNIDFIASIESYEKQTQMLILKNNVRVKVSITGYKALKKVLNL
ncbi:LytTR family DNA-binding domain-containing protein [Dysgonomonas sp. 216]|uniref:LytR/AlgR family response regulator transcription factor n=1 Tax=Dysgonomonas sp. 216 TaxID=2302934 RepID=UPI0013D87882|nr:LytTR family DNA-binding domain-containing protein [Dysgonomonas sp. 216]